MIGRIAAQDCNLGWRVHTTTAPCPGSVVAAELLLASQCPFYFALAYSPSVTFSTQSTTFAGTAYALLPFASKRMGQFELILSVFVAAVLLAAAARRVGAPYPVFLALGGALLAFVPGVPSLTLPPELALALFVAPVLLDAAYDTSLRDLRDNWAPVASLVIVAVGLTTAAVALVAHAIVPALPWAAAI